jgi:hypothetical protein
MRLWWIGSLPPTHRTGVHPVPVLDPLPLNHPASLLSEMEAWDDIGPSFKSYIRSILSGEALVESRLFDLECCTVLH